MKALLGRRRIKSPHGEDGVDGVDTEPLLDGSESSEAPAAASGGPSMLENVLYYGALLFVGILAGHSLMDIFDNMHYMNTPRTVTPAAPPPAPAYATPAPFRASPFQGYHLPEHHIIQPRPEAHMGQQWQQSAPKWQELRATSRAQTRPTLLDLKRLEVTALSMGGEKEAGRLGPKFKTSLREYEMFVQQEVNKVVLKLVPSETRQGTDLAPVITVDGTRLQALESDSDGATEVLYQSPEVMLRAKGSDTYVTIKLSPPGDSSGVEPVSYVVRVHRRADSLKQSTRDAQLALLQLRAPGAKRTAISPAFSPNMYHYEFNVSEVRTHLEVMALSVPVHSLSEYKQQAAKSAMAAMTANAGSDSVFMVVSASDPSASISINEMHSRVGARVTQHRLPSQKLSIGSNVVSISVTSVDRQTTELYSVTVNRQPVDVNKRIAAVVKARQAEVAKFLPKDNRAKADGVINSNIRRMVERCRSSPDPWVPLLGKLPTKESKQTSRQAIKSRVDELLEHAMSFQAIDSSILLVPPALELSADERAEDQLLKELVSRVSGAGGKVAPSKASQTQPEQILRGQDVHPLEVSDADNSDEGAEDEGVEDEGEGGLPDHRFGEEAEVDEGRAQDVGGVEAKEGLDKGDQEEGRAKAEAEADEEALAEDEEAVVEDDPDVEGELELDANEEGRGSLPVVQDQDYNEQEDGQSEVSHGIDNDVSVPAWELEVHSKAAEAQGGTEVEEEAPPELDVPPVAALQGEVVPQGDAPLLDVSHAEEEARVQRAHRPPVAHAEQEAEASEDTHSHDHLPPLLPAEEDHQGDGQGGQISPPEADGISRAGATAVVGGKQAEEDSPLGAVGETGEERHAGAVDPGESRQEEEEPPLLDVDGAMAGVSDDGRGLRLPAAGLLDEVVVAEGSRAKQGEAGRRLLAAAGTTSRGGLTSAKSRFLARQHARAGPGGSVHGSAPIRRQAAPLKEFSFEDNAVRAVKPQAKPQAPLLAAETKRSKSWSAMSSPPTQARIGWSLSHGDEPQQPQPRLQTQPQPAESSKEMVKMFQGVASAVGVFSPDGMAKNLKGSEKQVSACLRFLDKCEMAPETIADGLARLEGVKQLGKTPRCTVAYGYDGCDKLTGNPEHAGEVRKAVARAPVWLSPLETRKHESCAVVGNGRDLTSSDYHGAAIDAHEAVFRVNLAPTRLFEPYVGNRTTYRVLDAETIRALAEDHWKMPQGVALPRPGERWTVWNYDVLGPAPGAPAGGGGMEATLLARLWRQLEMTGFDLNLLSPEEVKWQVKVYFAFMADAVRLGLAPKVGGGTGWGFRQPATMSTGIHAVLLAHQLCDEVNLFGFSSRDAAGGAKEQQPGSPAAERYFEASTSRLDEAGVDWDRRVYEARFLQLLHLSSHAVLCTH